MAVKVNIELVRPAKVQGWCRAKALYRLNLADTMLCWFETAAPETKVQAAMINAAMEEVRKRTNAVI